MKHMVVRWSWGTLNIPSILLAVKNDDKPGFQHVSRDRNHIDLDDKCLCQQRYQLGYCCSFQPCLVYHRRRVSCDGAKKAGQFTIKFMDRLPFGHRWKWFLVDRSHLFPIQGKHHALPSSHEPKQAWIDLHQHHHGTSQSENDCKKNVTWLTGLTRCGFLPFLW